MPVALPEGAPQTLGEAFDKEHLAPQLALRIKHNIGIFAR